MVKAFIFDNDGVLVDSEASQIAAWKTFFSRHRVSYPDRELHLLTRGRPAREVMAIAFPRATFAETKLMATEREEIHMSLLRQGIQTVNGIAHFLDTAKRAGYRLVVGTSAHRAKLAYILTATKLIGYFDSLVTYDDVRQGKPDPEVFELAAAKAGVNKNECVVFEDAFNGVEAARRAGMKAIVLTTSHDKSEFSGDNIIAYCRDFSLKERNKILSVIRALP